MLKSSSLCIFSSNLGTFWLKIEQFCPFEEISIFSNGCRLGCRTALTDTIFKEYITGFIMNFELLPILTDYANYKKGEMELKKKCSPLKLLSQSRPFEEISILVMVAILDTGRC
jgi:hypothetical protein